MNFHVPLISWYQFPDLLRCSVLCLWDTVQEKQQPYCGDRTHHEVSVGEPESVDDNKERFSNYERAEPSVADDSWRCPRLHLCGEDFGYHEPRDRSQARPKYGDKQTNNHHRQPPKSLYVHTCNPKFSFLEKYDSTYLVSWISNYLFPVIFHILISYISF